MMTTQTSSAPYLNRLPDQSFTSFDQLIQIANHDRQYSMEKTYNLKDLRVVVDGDRVKLASPKGTADLTHWSFGQLNGTVGSPAKYQRTLSPELIAANLTYGLHHSEPGSTANLLVKANGVAPIVRACTSETYGRVWDADLFNGLAHMTGQLRGDWTLEAGYRSDRDTFITLTTKQAVIHDPSVQSRELNDIMYRSIVIRNSEVGASSVVIDSGMFVARCKNLALWALLWGSQYRRRHVGSRVLRDVLREVSNVAYKLVTASAERDNAIIRTLIQNEIAHTKEAVVDELRKMGATKEQAEDAYARCEQTEEVSPRSYWGIAQGMTRISQDSGFQNDRYELDQLAARIMQRGARLVAA